MANSGKIQFFFPFPTTLAHRTNLKAFIEKIFRREGKRLGGLNYVFCSDKALLKINREYLKHDYYTDIITFDLTEPGQLIQAEIHISVERVKDNAAQMGIPFKTELHRVIFHGVLHLCGYGDKSRQESIEMRTRENYYLEQYFT